MTPKDAGLRRHLGLVDAVSLFVGIILGSGIFVAPAAVAGATASPWAAVALWVAGGVVCACGAVCYAECASRLPRSGGFFVFYREAFGESVAFVSGWAALTVTYPASIAAIALVLARYASDLAGPPTENRWIAATAIVLAGVVNAAGLRTGPRAQRVLTVTKVGALALLCVAALAGARGAAVGAPVPTATDGIALLGAVLVLLWTYDGWSDVTLVAGEVRDPGRNLGRAVLIGALTLAALYALVQVAVAILLSPERAASSPQVVAEAVEAGLGPGASKLVAVLVVVSTFGSVQGVILTTARLGFAMAAEGVFPSRFGTIHPRLHTPAASTAWVVATALVYVFVAEFRVLLSYFSFAVWCFYGLTACALLILRRRAVGEPVAWRAPAGVIPPVVLLSTGATVTIGLAIGEPARAAAGLAMLAAGFPVYFAWRALRRVRARRSGSVE